MKICKTCEFERDDNLFSNRENKCKECIRLYQKEYQKKNANILKDKKKEYYIEHREYIIQHKKKFYQDNKEKALEYEKEHYLENKSSILAQQKLYIKANKEKVRKYHRRYRKNRLVVDPLFKLRVNCSRLIHHALFGNKNNLSILDYLPYTMAELKFHLEKQFDSKMSWNNYGSYWHIDHIIPQSKLPYMSMTEDNFKKCWILSNLQPLEAITNMKKGTK
jgi:hypothetical protein